MSEHVDGEAEGTAQLIADAKAQYIRFSRPHQPIPAWLITLFSWLARESFRAGHRRAHQRPTVPTKRDTPAVEAMSELEITFDDTTPVTRYPGDKL